MRKRRVLALLLALSLVVSGNGMTVLAEELGTDMPVSTSQEGTQETDDKSGKGEDIPGNAENSSETGEKSEEGKEPSKEEKPSDENKDPVKPSDENKDPVHSGESNPSVPKEDDAEQSGDQSGTEEGEDGKQDKEPAAGEQEPTVSENDVDAGADVKETTMAQPYVSRMVTFTDDIGMRVTYDANASQLYDYVVEDGVLTSVKVKDAEQEVTFKGNVELKQPEEGDKYTSIAANIFGGNTEITYVKLPAGVTTVAADSFKGCTGLKSVYLPSTVNTIGAGAFENCTAMTQISVPKAVTAIGNNAFKNDARLHLVYIKDVDYCDLRTIGENAFEGCATLAEFCSDREFVLPMKLESIGEAAFKGCKAIRKVDFTDTKLSTVGAHAFEGCIGITDLWPGKTLALVSEYAFAGCTALSSINFVNGRNMTIDHYAFQNCIGLKQMTLPQSVIAVRNYAFAGCTRLTRVELKCYNIEIGDQSGNGELVAIEAFPSNAAGLVIIAEKDSEGYRYARRNKLLPTENAFYKYTVEDVNGAAVKDGRFPGGELLVTTDPASDSDINKQNSGQGVKAGEKCWVFPKQTTDAQRKNYTFIAGSLRCNGLPMEKENQKYFFIMPEGGAVITAEFRANTPDKINGQTATVEFSAGVPLYNGEQDKNGYLGVELKVGQTTRMFLLDANEESISTSKLKFSSKNPKVATVSSSGVITAVGTNGAEMADTEIEVKVIGGDGREFTVTRTVVVKTAEAKSITLKATKYDSDMKITGEADGIQTAVISKTIVAEEPYTVTLKANVYDGEDSVGKILTWTTSDTKVASLASAKTEANNPVNVVTIKKGCEGEATITVTANNAAGAEREKATQKFVIRVYREGYRLTTSSITVNPNMKDGGSIELISTSGLGIGSEEIKLYAEKELTTTQFIARYDPDGSEDNCKKFNIVPIAPTLQNGTYKVRVGVGDSVDERNFLPLTITVKRTTPAPAIKFNSKRTKFNLFYKDGRNTADENAPVVTTEITKLGNAEIRDVKLEALSNKSDDKLFEDNFEIDKKASDFASGIVIIKRTSGNLKYTSRKQPAITGNLVIYFEGYEDSAAKRMRVTMPTCTIAPTYALRETSATYCRDLGVQNETLVLYDRKSRTKEQIVLGNNDHVTASSDKIWNLNNSITIADGAIPISFTPDNGKIRLTLRNDTWDCDKNGDPRQLTFDFQVRVSLAKPTVKISQNNVSLNVWYPETEAQFTLVSNQKGLKIAGAQTFTPVVNRSNEENINKLEVTYADGVGTAKIKAGQTVKKGSYSFKCTPATTNYSETLKDVTLTVKVVDNKPTVKMGRGSLQLNKAAFSAVSSIDAGPEEAKGEVSEIPFTVSGTPEGYGLLPVGTGDENTKIVCTTRGKENAAGDFVFTVKADEPENILTVSLNTKNLQAMTYRFTMTPKYKKEGAATATLLEAKPVNFNVKVYDNGDIKLRAAARGKINLLNRSGEASDKNGIVYTPTLQNLQGQITDVKIYDGRVLTQESAYFDISMIGAGKDEGKFFVKPKADASLEYNKNYPVTIWVKVKGYGGKVNGGVVTDPLSIRAMQVLPKVTTDKSMINTYLSTKNYNASFVVTPKEGSVGKIESVAFGAKDDKAKESFALIQEERADGSMKVTVHLKEGVEYPNGSTNTVKMYVKYKGQGYGTSETATTFSMKIKVN